MRYDIENAAADVVVAYLRSVVDAAIQNVDDKDGNPQSIIVTFYDPMSVDEANRIVVRCPDGETMKESMANGGLSVEVGIKSQWKQPTIEADFEAHFARVAEVRDKLFPVDLIERLNAAAAAADPPITGIGIDYVAQGRKLYTDVREGWLYSETGFQMNYFMANN
jgi:hypothetical protein